MSKRDFIENCIFYGIIIGIIFVGCKYLLPVMTPFIVGFAIAYFAHEVSKKFTKDMNKASKVIVLILIYILFLIVAILLITYIFDRIKIFVGWVSTNSANIEPMVNRVYKALLEWNKNLPSIVKKAMDQATSSIFDTLKDLLLSVSTVMISMVTGVITSLPSLFVSTMVAIISSFYILLDYERVFASIKSWMPLKAQQFVDSLAHYVKDKLLKIIGSYATIMFITFMELLVGFMIFKIGNAGIFAALIAVLDILPVLGVGTVLIPWALVDFILGNPVQGVCIALLYVVITVIRNVIEPKLVGDDLGLDALTTLIAMIAGLKLFGVLGMFGIPLGLSFYLYLINERKNEASINE